MTGTVDDAEMLSLMDVVVKRRHHDGRWLGFVEWGVHISDQVVCACGSKFQGRSAIFVDYWIVSCSVGLGW